MTRVLVTGGAGFIGSNFIRFLLRTDPNVRLTNVDALTYAGNLASLAGVAEDDRYTFVRADITSAAAMAEVFGGESHDLVINFAAESHVDRSILDAAAFVRTNVVGTQVLLDACRSHGVNRFCQVSTDEVYGSLSPSAPPFTEGSPIDPSSPYSASKAAADHLCSACHRTYGQDVVITRCSNNYGPYQFPEKFIGLCVTHALQGKALPIYGDGLNVRDWIHVQDHCAGVWAAARRGQAGRVYNFGGGNEWPNLEIARRILLAVGQPESLLHFVKDRPGHDRRYAMDYSRAAVELGWAPRYDFEAGLAETVAWYKAHQAWWEAVTSGAYRDYYEEQYGSR